MEADLRGASLALAREALVPPQSFDPASKRLFFLLEKVYGILKSLPLESVSANVAEYVYFPLHSLLQQSELTARSSELLLRILTIILSTAWRDPAFFDLQKAQQLTAVTAYLLSPDPPNLSQSTSPLEPSKAFLEKPSSLHAAGFECLNAVFTSASFCGFGSELGRAPTMAHIISILLTGIQYDAGDLESQKQGIVALTTVLRDIVVNPDHRALVLPRVASKLAKFVAPTNRKHYTAKAAAITCLQEIVVGSMSDASFAQNKPPSTIRTEAWIQKTAEPLSQTFQILRNLLIAVQSNQSGRPELIESLYRFASTVYSQCHRTFEAHSETCIDILMGILVLCASQNVNLDIASNADAFIRQSEFAPKHMKTGIVKQIQSLPSALESPDEDRALLLLKSLQKSVAYVDSPETHEAVLDSIVGAIPLSVNKSSRDVVPLSQVQALNTFNPQDNSMIRLSDLGLSLPLTVATQDLICRVVAELARNDGSHLIGSLSDSLDLAKTRGSGSLDGTLYLWCVAAAIPSLPKESDLYDIIAYCYEDVTSSMDIHNTNTNSLTPAKYAHTAMCCYVIGEAALNQGHLFEEHLVDLLHPIFCMLGDCESVHIRREAGRAISKIAFACGYESPAKLAIANKDYLIDGISTQLNTLNFTPSTPSALVSLIYISGPSIIPYLNDVFSSLFVLLDHYHGYSLLVKGILVVFSAMISVVGRSVVQANANIAAHPTKAEFVPTFAELLEELERKPHVDPSILDKKVDLNTVGSERITEIQEDEDAAQNQDSDDEESDISEEHENAPEDIADQAAEKWESPIAKPVYTTLERIAGYCDRLMTHESPDIRLAVLSLITRITPYLALNSEHFLPLVHKTWPEAISRAFDPEIYVVEESFNCLAAITTHARDFVSTRIASLWPQVAKSYGSLFKRHWPRFSAEHRKQDAVIKFMTAVLESIPDLELATTESMTRMVRPALVRGEFTNLSLKIQKSCAPSVQDLAWVVTLQEPVSAPSDVYHSIMPIYNF